MNQKGIKTWKEGYKKRSSMMGMKFEGREEKYRITVMAILLAGTCFFTYYCHVILGTGRVFTHFFYIPIILASLWWRRKGLGVAVFLAALLIFSSIFLRAEVVTANDYLRAIMFIVIAFVIAKLSEQITKAEEQIKTSLEEKKVLLKEIHHRVKNNLQVISSLLNLQSRYIKDKQALEMCRESQNRIKSMAFVHEKLYQSKDVARIDLTGYIRELATNLCRLYGVNSNAVAVKINIEDISLGVDLAVPLGLIINELISNSLKYAFPKGKKGEIRIDLRSDNDRKFTLTVSDNGVGFPKDLDFRNTKSLGLQLVCTLINQIYGTIELDRSRGTEFEITFTTVNNCERRTRQW